MYGRDVVDKLLEEDTMPKVEAWLAQKKAAGKHNNCTLENAAVRREWCVFTVRYGGPRPSLGLRLALSHQRRTNIGAIFP